MTTIVKYEFFSCKLKKEAVCTIFFHGVTMYEDYLCIFVQLPSALTLSDAHHGKVADRILRIMCVCVCARACYHDICEKNSFNPVECVKLCNFFLDLTRPYF